MSGRIALFVLFLIMLTAAPAGAVDADSVIGFWNTQDNDALFEIYSMRVTLLRKNLQPGRTQLSAHRQTDARQAQGGQE